MSESTLTCKRTLSETGTVGVGAGDSDNAEDAKKLCVKDNDNDNEDGCEETAEPLEADAEQEQPVEQQVDTEKQSRVFGMKERVNKTFKRFFGKIKQKYIPLVFLSFSSKSSKTPFNQHVDLNYKKLIRFHCERDRLEWQRGPSDELRFATNRSGNSSNESKRSNQPGRVE